MSNEYKDWVRDREDEKIEILSKIKQILENHHASLVSDTDIYLHMDDVEIVKIGEIL